MSRGLCGAVLFFDVIRTARRGRYILLRIAYVSAILALFCVFNDVWNVPARNSSALAEFGSSIFATFMVTQFAAVFLLAPPYVATALTEEKEGKTFEFLLATDLRNHEMVLGKLVSRLSNLFLLVLAGLPILSLLEMLGGIDPTPRHPKWWP